MADICLNENGLYINKCAYNSSMVKLIGKEEFSGYCKLKDYEVYQVL